MAIGDTYPGDPIGRRTLSRVTPPVSQETQGVSWTAPWKDLWDDSLTQKAATGIMNVARDVVRPGTRNLMRDVEDAAIGIAGGLDDFVSSAGKGVSDYTKKYVTGGWKDLGKEILEVIATPVDTALSLASGMATSVAAPYAALPTLLRSDDPFTRKGSEGWREKMTGAAESIPTYHARTPAGKNITRGVGAAWDLWNEQVAARAGRGIEMILESVGVDYKNAQRAGAITSGVVGAAPVILPSVVRVRGEPGVLPGKDASPASIRNARRNQLANIANPEFMARLWMQMDPKGFAKAKADGTLSKKLSDMGWEFNEHISGIPVLVEELGTRGEMFIKPEIVDGKKRVTLGWPYKTDRVGEYRPLSEEISLDPTALEIAKQYGDTGTAAHEMFHAVDRHAYKELFPEGPPIQLFEEWLREESARGRKVGEENFRDLAEEHLELRKKTEKNPWGYSTDVIPSVKKLSDKLSKHQLDKQKREVQRETPAGEEPSGYYPPPPEGYEGRWNFYEWENSIRKEISLVAKPTELGTRLDGLQRFMKEADIPLTEVLSKREITGPGNWIDVSNTKFDKAPFDVKQLLKYLDDLVLDRYQDITFRESTTNTIESASVYKSRFNRAEKYVMDMLTEALADTKITFPTKYKVGLVGR